MHDEAAIILPTAAEGDSVQSAPVESSPEYGSSPTRVPETRPTSQPQPTHPSSRFSTALDIQSRQTFIIDISDDDEDEEEEESAQHTFGPGSYHSIDSSNSPLSESARVPQSSSEQQPAVLQSIGNVDTDTTLTRPQCEHDVDPPFVTDGRGRVVWSSTRNASGRGTATEGRASRHSRTGSAPRIACPSPGSTLLVSSARGHAWDGQDTQGIDGKVGGGEERSEMD